MSEVISLSPTMQRRMNFQHDLLDDVDEYKIEMEDLEPIIDSWLEFGRKEDRDQIILGVLWVAKDGVCRYRAHYPSVRYMTDDLASAAIEFVTEFVSNLEHGEDFFNRVSATVVNRLSDYINDNRSSFSASRCQNVKLEAEGEDPVYNFAVEYNDELNGAESADYNLVDYLDSVQAYVQAFRAGEIDVDDVSLDFIDSVDQLASVDSEELRDLVLGFLSADHSLAEEELTPTQKALLENISKVGSKIC